MTECIPSDTVDLTDNQWYPHFLVTFHPKFLREKWKIRVSDVYRYGADDTPTNVAAEDVNQQ